MTRNNELVPLADCIQTVYGDAYPTFDPEDPKIEALTLQRGTGRYSLTVRRPGDHITFSLGTMQGIFGEGPLGVTVDYVDSSGSDLPTRLTERVSIGDDDDRLAPFRAVHKRIQGVEPFVSEVLAHTHPYLTSTNLVTLTDSLVGDATPGNFSHMSRLMLDPIATVRDPNPLAVISNEVCVIWPTEGRTPLGQRPQESEVVYIEAARGPDDQREFPAAAWKPLSELHVALSSLYSNSLKVPRTD